MTEWLFRRGCNATATTTRPRLQISPPPPLLSNNNNAHTCILQLFLPAALLLSSNGVSSIRFPPFVIEYGSQEPRTRAIRMCVFCFPPSAATIFRGQGGMNITERKPGTSASSTPLGVICALIQLAFAVLLSLSLFHTGHTYTAHPLPPPPAVRPSPELSSSSQLQLHLCFFTGHNSSSSSREHINIASLINISSAETGAAAGESAFVEMCSMQPVHGRESRGK